MTRSIPSLALACLLALAARAEAQPSGAADDAQLAEIRELIFQARFDDAVQASEAYLGRPDLGAAQRNAGLEVMATAQIANRDRAAAEQTLRRLYARDPGHRLTDPDASPPVIAAFSRAREQAPEPVTVAIEHEPPRLARRESPEIVATLSEGADAVDELRLLYQIEGEDPGRVVMTPHADGRWAGRIPVVGAATEPSTVTYRLVALAPSGTPLASLGAEDEPLRVTIPGGETTSGATGGGERPPVLQGDPDQAGRTTEDGDGGGSVAEQWWFWTIIGVLVVGGAVTAGVLIGTSQGGPQEGTLGTARLMQLEF